MSEPPIIGCAGITVRRGTHIVCDIAKLDIASGESLALIGPNGSGKTSLLLALAGLIRLQSGMIVFQGRPLRSRRDRLAYRRRCAMVFQDPLLFDTSVFRNVAAGLAIRGLGRIETRKRVFEYLERFNIAHCAERSAKKLSGGEARRVSLARALVTRPDILFLDEPFASIDPAGRESIIADFQAAVRDTGITLLLATHDRFEALALAESCAVIERGAIVQREITARTLNRPVNEFAASFSGMDSVLDGSIKQSMRGSAIVEIEGKPVEAVTDAAPGSAVALCIRPEDVSLSVGHRQNRTSVRNAFQGVIVSISPMGLYYKVRIDCGFPLIASVTRGSMEKLNLAENKRVTASFKATAVHVIKK